LEDVFAVPANVYERPEPEEDRRAGLRWMHVCGYLVNFIEGKSLLIKK